MPIPADNYGGAAYGKGDWLVVATTVPGATRHVLFRVHPDGSGKEMLNLPDPLTCQRRDYQDLVSLSDGGVGYVIECDPFDTTQRVEEFPWLYDPISDTSRQLTQAPFELGPGQFTWNSTLNRGIFSSYRSPCSEIAWLDKTGASPFEGVSVGDGPARWALKNDWNTDNGCTGMGLTGAADWSPDGKRIAFFASQGAPKPGDSPNMDAPFDLYIMDAAALQPRVALKALIDPGSIRWSPDSNWLVFNASVDGKYGIWLFRPGDGHLIRVSGDEDGGVTWSTDGSKILGLSSLASNADLGNLVTFDVTGITGP